jgi:hypothetical protein
MIFRVSMFSSQFSEVEKAKFEEDILNQLKPRQNAAQTGIKKHQ